MSTNESLPKEEVSNIADDAKTAPDKNHADSICESVTIANNMEIKADARRKESPSQPCENNIVQEKVQTENFVGRANVDGDQVECDTEHLATPLATRNEDQDMNRIVFQTKEKENMFSTISAEKQNAECEEASGSECKNENNAKNALDQLSEVDATENSQSEELGCVNNANSAITIDAVEQRPMPITIPPTTQLSESAAPSTVEAMECDNLKPNIISVIVLPDAVTTREVSTLNPNSDEDVNENQPIDYLKNDIPMSITEIALREMQQIEAIKVENPMITPVLPSSGLGLLASQYESSEDEDDDSSCSDSDSSDSDESVQEVQQQPSIADGSYRNKVIDINSESDSDSSDSVVEVVSQTQEMPNIIDVDALEEEDLNENKHRGPVRVKGEILLEDLPPIHDLHITVPEAECVELGKIHSIIDQLILVNSIPGTAPLNLDTVLFLEKGQKVLGEVFDVLGQVTSPLYCIRFNSNKQIKERGIEIGQIVYMAPRTEHTHFVILENMMKLRGSDASWENDIEPSAKHLDYSDDEEERNARRALRNRDRDGEESDPAKRQRPAPSPSPSSSRSLSPQPTSRFQPRQHRQRFPRYRGSAPNDGYNHGFQYAANPRFQQPPPFMYGPSNASWHANFNPSQPPPPYPYQYPSNQPYFAPHTPFMPPPSVMQRPPYVPPTESVQRPPYVPPPESMQRGAFAPPPEVMQHRFFSPPPPPRQ